MSLHEDGMFAKQVGSFEGDEDQTVEHGERG